MIGLLRKNQDSPSPRQHTKGAATQGLLVRELVDNAHRYVQWPAACDPPLHSNRVLCQPFRLLAHTTMSSKLFNFTLERNPLDLEVIRGILTRLEDTIIFALIERAQFAHNPKAYERGAFQELKDIGFEGSWLGWFLKETECFQGA